MAVITTYFGGFPLSGNKNWKKGNQKRPEKTLMGNYESSEYDTSFTANKFFRNYRYKSIYGAMKIKEESRSHNLLTLLNRKRTGPPCIYHLNYIASAKVASYLRFLVRKNVKSFSGLLYLLKMHTIL